VCVRVRGKFVGGESSGSGGESSGISGGSSRINGRSSNSSRYNDSGIMIRDDNIIAALIYFFCLCHGIAESFIEE